MNRLKHMLAIAMIAGTVSAQAPSEGVAVVELFTSEGCSSCPPADKVLSDLRAKGDERTILVAWHVDYWDYLGWEDRFGDAAHSARQRRAATELGSSVYTPQAVVNGTTEFVGGDAAKARAAVEAARAVRPHVTVTATASRSADGKSVEVSYAAKPAPDVRLAPGLRVDVVLTEDGLSSDVAKGENAGRTLHHDAVVRAVSTQTLQDTMSGNSRLKVPAGVNLDNARVVLLVRGKDGYSVIGAAAVPLGS